MKQLLLISGKRESGKSLLASFLEHYHGWVRFSLADELKREVMRDWKLQPNQLWGKDKEVPTGYFRRQGQPLTARDIMIRHGEYRRCIDELHWCKQFNPGIGDKIVIDDLRFNNEVKYFRDLHKAKFVRIERDAAAIGKAALDDQSETEMDSFAEWDFKLSKEHNNVPEDLRVFAGYLDAHLSK